MKTFEYRLYPNRAQNEALFACLAESRQLYNEMLEASKARYEAEGKFLFKYDLCKSFAGKATEHVPATTVQCLADRLDKTLKRFLDARKHPKKYPDGVGFPRFKSANQWYSIHLRQWGKGRDVVLSDDGRRLRVPGKLGGSIKVKLHRPLEGIPKTCHLVHRADGHWYALVVCELEPVAPTTEDTRPDVGIDLGLSNFVADSNGNTIKPPKFFRKSERKLRVAERQKSRRKLGGNRRRKAARLVAKTHLKIARQRRDWLFKTAKPYADGFGTIFVEDLNVHGMAQNGHLSKSIHDASWSEFLNILTCKAERAGGEVVRVSARYTSQICSRCGGMVRKSLSVRTHVCPHCGLIEDRDINAAKNILGRGTALRAKAQALA